MLNARNLCGLLSENTDEYAWEYIVFTTHGTLLGYSDTTNIKKSRKAAALFGVTWRATNLALINNNQDPKSNRGILLKVITTTKDPDGKLAMVAVEFENMIATIHEVKDSILVAALVEVKPIMENLPGNVSNNNTAEIANMSGSNNNNNTAPSSNGQTPPDTTTHEHEAQEPPTTPAPASNKANDEEEETPSSPPTPTPTPSRPKPSQLQILTWRVEAMAEALREDLQDFKMPQGTF